MSVLAARDWPGARHALRSVHASCPLHESSADNRSSVNCTGPWKIDDRFDEASSRVSADCDLDEHCHCSALR